MKQKLTEYTSYLFGFFFAVFCFSFVFSLLPASTTLAYTCSHGGPNHDGKIKLNTGQVVDIQGGENGTSCYIMVPDKPDNTHRKLNADGSVSCDGGTVKHDDQQCWAYKRLDSTEPPTNDDGSKIPDAYFQNVCERQPTYYGMHWNYNKDANACQVAGGCSDVSKTIVQTQILMDDNSMCRRIGDGTQTLADTVGPDTTGKKNDTTCSDGSTVAAGQQCPPGTTATNAGTPVKVDDPSTQETFGSCGQHGTDNKDVKTVLIGCDSGVCNTGSSGWSSAFKGTPVIACVIKFGVSALTVLVGVGAVAGIAWEAFKYAKAQDDQTAVSDARKRMRDIVIGLIVYIFMAVAINWIVPGGVIGG